MLGQGTAPSAKLKVSSGETSSPRPWRITARDEGSAGTRTFRYPSKGAVDGRWRFQQILEIHKSDLRPKRQGARPRSRDSEVDLHFRPPLPSEPSWRTDSFQQILESKVDPMVRKTTMRRVRKGKGRGPKTGFIVTWDVDSTDRTACNRLHRFLFGDTTHNDGRTYRYPGFIEKEGVRYLGQSVIFVIPRLRSEIQQALVRFGVDHEATLAQLG